MLILDVIAVMIGFAAVMGMLSLIVTALVQLTVSWFGLRGRNLRWGLQILLEQILEQSPQEAKSTAKNVVDAGRLRAPGAAQRARQLSAVGKFLNAIWDRMTNPQITWITPEQLPDRISNAGVGNITAAKKKKIAAQFKDMDGYLCKRFGFHTRQIVVAWSLGVAFLFQLNSVTLLKDLSTDSHLRESLVAEAETLYGEAEAIMQQLPAYSDVSAEALRLLREKYPNLAAQIDEASGEGGSREYIIRELELVLSDVPEQRDAVIRDYGRMLDQLHQAAIDDATRLVDQTTQRLAKFDIRPWKDGWTFYRDAGNIFGVAVTTILLTFGAPFWFELLGQLLRLRDILGPTRGGNAAVANGDEE